MLSASLFVAVAAGLCIATVLAIVGIINVEMEGPQGIERNGLAPGSRAPGWTLADSAEGVHRSPPDKPLQLIVFTSHSLKSFPSVVDGLREFAAQAAEVDVVVLLRGPSAIAEPVLRALGLDYIPVLTGSPALYGRYNVRATPWMMFVDAQGRVRASSLVNHDWQISKLHQLARLPLGAPEARPGGRSGRRTSRAGV